MKEWKIMMVNIGGGRLALEWALQQDVHILLIQEHKGTKEKVASYQTLAIKYKWNGVWTPAPQEEAGKKRRSGDTRQGPHTRGKRKR